MIEIKDIRTEAKNPMFIIVIDGKNYTTSKGTLRIYKSETAAKKIVKKIQNKS